MVGPLLHTELITAGQKLRMKKQNPELNPLFIIGFHQSHPVEWHL